MQKRLTHLLFIVLFILPFAGVKAEPSYDLNNLTNILQSEYRSQLKQNQNTQKALKKAPQTRHKKPSRPRPPATAHLNQTQKLHKQTLRVMQRATPLSPAHQEAPDPRALFKAASSGNNQYIERLLQQGININTANNERETALHMAAAHGHYSTVIYLINHGANLHSRTIKNWLPLHHATRFSHADIANYLKRRSSSPYARTSDGLSAIDMAKNNNDRRMIHVLSGQ